MVSYINEQLAESASITFQHDAFEHVFASVTPPASDRPRNRHAMHRTPHTAGHLTSVRVSDARLPPSVGSPVSA